MSGLGRKVWTTGEVLAAAEVNGYLMDQSVMVFDDAAARLASIPTPTEGMLSYTKNDKMVQVYNGTAWTAVDTTISTINASNVINTQTDTSTNSYTFAPTDNGRTIRFTSGSAVSATVSDLTALVAGQRIDVIRDGAGTVTIVAGSGVTLAGAGTLGTAYTMRQYDAATIYCVAADTYRVIGNVTVA